MLVHELLTSSSCLCSLEGGSKKRIIERISGVIADQHPGLDADTIFDGLHAREKLGSTGIGEGVAIPHSRLAECQNALGYLVKLNEAVDFDAIDGNPVDLLFVLIVPEDATSEHLQTLSSVAELFSQESVRNELRQAETAEQLFQAIGRYSRS